MKIRNGFVRNSSSSSFIVASNGDELKIKITKDISDLVTHTIKTKEDIIKYFEEERLEFNDYSNAQFQTVHEYINQMERKLYEKCMDAIAQGKTIFMGDCSNDESSISSLIYYEGFESQEGIDVIEDD